MRTIYAYGVLCYELYTVAGDQARLFIEQALRDRFLPFYNGGVPFIDAKGQPQSITATDYWVFYEQLHSNGRLHKGQNWKLKLRSGRAPMRFDGMLDSLLRWARAEGLLGGQRDRVRDRPRVALRNFAAHPSYHLGTPPDAAAELADLAAIINRLWGEPFMELVAELTYLRARTARQIGDLPCRMLADRPDTPGSPQHAER